MAPTLDPFLAAGWVIQLHAVAAVLAFLLGLSQLALPKGTGRHRTIGWVWVIAMATVAASAFFIHTIEVIGAWSPIHVLSVVTLAALPGAVAAARAHKPRAHARAMISLFAFALLIAGAFTFWPGRMMHAMVCE